MQSSKAIIMAGSAGAGKNYILNQLEVLGLPIFDADNYTEDKEHEHYNNLSAASRLTDKEVQTAVENKESFVWNTTAGNSKKIEQITDAGYDVAMVMVYTHPVVSIISNFSREKRSVNMSAVLSTWRNTYSLIEFYKVLLGNNFYLVSNNREDSYKDQIENFNKAANSGKNGILQFVEDLKKQNPEWKSTYSKPFEIEKKEDEDKYKEAVKGLESQIGDDKDMTRKLQKHFMSFWGREVPKMPPTDSMQKKINAISKERVDSKEEAETVASDISKMLNNQSFEEVLSFSHPVEKVRSNLQSFLRS